MAALFEIGFEYVEKSEKGLINDINQVLSETFPIPQVYRLTKVKSQIMLKAREPFKYAYIYNCLIKKDGIYIEIYPNEDMEGRKKFIDANYKWLMFVNSIGFYVTDGLEVINTDNPKAEGYIQQLQSKIKYSNRVLYKYNEGEERL